MGNRTFQRLTIGGDPGIQRGRLMELISEYGFDEIEELDDCLVCDANDVSMGCDQIEEIKSLLRYAGMSYDHFYEARYENDGCIFYWRPGLSDDGETECFILATQNGRPLILTEELRAWMAEGMTIEKILETYDLPELPAWVTDDELLLNIATGETS